MIIMQENRTASYTSWVVVKMNESLYFESRQKTEKTEFLSFFYKYCMQVLTAPLLANTVDEKKSKGEEGDAFLYFNLWL